MIRICKISLVTSGLYLLLVATPALANDDYYRGGDRLDLLLELTVDFLLHAKQRPIILADHRPRRRDHHLEYRQDYREPSRHDQNFAHAHRNDYGFRSHTSQPIRGGSSRRTRVIENPYSDRLVTGITLTGIDNDYIHVKDVIAYPARQYLSPLAYTLSRFHPPRFINTGHYIDYISVQAKRKEYFTVTFHYD